MENKNHSQMNSPTTAALCSPESFTLTAAPGYTITAECQRNSAGEVLINAVCEGDFTESTVIGHIPQGFRPRTELNEVVQMLGGNSSQSNVLRVATGGEMHLLHGGLNMSKCYFTLGYVAEGEASGCPDTYTKVEIDALLASKANKGHPDVQPLATQMGTGSRGNYYKTDSNMVFGRVQIENTDGSAFSAGSYTFAQFPEGYRPIGTSQAVGVLSLGSSTGYAAYCWVNPNGEARLNIPQGISVNQIIGTFYFSIG